jgi:hypothetical protein
MTTWKIFAVSCGVSLAAFVLGIGAMIRWGPEISGWVLTTILALFMIAALIYGFTDTLPRLDWLRTRPVRGAALLCLGVAAVFVPPAFVIATLCVGVGVRMVWASACELEAGQAAATVATLLKAGTELVAAEPPGGQVAAVPSGNHLEFQHVRGESAD